MAARTLARWSMIVDGERLVITAGDHRLTLCGWGAGFGLYLKGHDVSCDGFPLPIPVISDIAVPNPWPLVHHIIDTGWLGQPDKASRMAAAVAFGRLLAAIPAEVRKVVARTEHLQWRLMEMIAAEPGLGAFLATNDGGRSRQYAMAAISAYLDRKDGDATPAAIARRIMFEAREMVLGSLYGCRVTRGVLKLLGQLGDAPLVGDGYVVLFRTAVDDNELRALLQKGDNLHQNLAKLGITSRTLAARGVREFRLPVFRLPPIRQASPFSEGISPIPGQAPHLLPSLRLPRPSSILPAPPFAVRNMLEPLTTEMAMIHEGDEMRHCVATLVDKVVAGKAYYYRWLGPERATVAIRKSDAGWIVGPIKGRRNAKISAATIVEITELVGSLQA